MKKSVAWYAFERRHLLRASCLHALTVAEMGNLRASGMTAPICVIPNGVDLGVPGERSRAGRTEKRLLYLGRLHEKKGIANLLAAWSEFKKSRSMCEWRLVVAGWGEKRFVDEIKMQSNGLSDVHFAGPIFGVAKEAALRDAEAVILPSISEGLPLVILEAWSYGVMTLMTDHCNLPEGFVRGAAVRIGTGKDDICDGLRRLAAMSDEERRSAGWRGRELVSTRYSWSRVAQQMSDVYRWTAAGAPTAAMPSTVTLNGR